MKISRNWYCYYESTGVLLKYHDHGSVVHFPRSSVCYKTERNRDVFNLVWSLNRGGWIYLIILKSLSALSHYFGLSMASSFFSPISSTCSTTCLLHIIFGRPHLFLSLQNPTLFSTYHHCASQYMAIPLHFFALASLSKFLTWF